MGGPIAKKNGKSSQKSSNEKEILEREKKKSFRILREDSAAIIMQLLHVLAEKGDDCCR
jgi:hypothetical protein